MKILNFTLVLILISAFGLKAQEGWVAGDFHQHTTFTDGSYNIDHVMLKNNAFGLDWWANSEHGGAFNRDGRTSTIDITTYWTDASDVTLLGDQAGESPYYKMWRWQMLKDFEFDEILEARALYPSKVIVQSYEMNVPGHEHASMGLLGDQFDSENPNVNDLAKFEYMFDAGDTDETGGAAQGWTKSSASDHAKTLEALAWLQANHKSDSYVIPAHPERKQLYTISDFRDMNNEAPDVCFGFESMPGHQKNANRGGYSTSADGGGTYGGCGVYAAEVGGLWDAMLTEGRNWWLFASSDFHSENGDFYPGEYQKTYTYVSDKTDAQSIIDGLRSGNSWVVEGDLINQLDFTIESNEVSATMGETLEISGNAVTVKITVTDPDADNNNVYTSYTNPALNHIDLIMGEVSGVVKPNDVDYDVASVATTSVIARFDATGNVTDGNGIISTAWTDNGNGEYTMEYTISDISGPIYLRLRGTNLGLGVENQTDANGNPLLDFDSSISGAEEAFADLWFYSNPVFVAMEDDGTIEEGWVAGDFHQHTTFTDGSYNIDHMMAKNNAFGLDWWANSEHGGARSRDGRTSTYTENTYWSDDASVEILGDEAFDGIYQKMWRWQILRDYQFDEILEARELYPSKVIIQSYEMNVPGHEHASMGLLGNQFDAENPNVSAIAQFEYMFDNGDTDATGGAAQGWTKSTATDHAKTLEALAWLQENHPTDSYVVPAHPERKQLYTISDFRDMNNEAPDVCFGFESMPGHQKNANRGGYSTSADGGGTYGGCGVYAAEIGGLWDAMLSEGRNWWLFASSDCHSESGDFYPGEYQKTYTYVSDKSSAQAIVDGLRSGNSWVVEGDLISTLDFTVEVSGGEATMGEMLSLPEGTVTIKITVTDPTGTNNNTYTEYNAPDLNHIDLIMGEVSGTIDPTADDYNTASVATTSVIARFDATGNVTDGNGITTTAWTNEGDGVYTMEYTISDITNIRYFRLRGTNQGLSVENQTDANGNPLLDFDSSLTGAEEAFADLWFYSNPIFVSGVDDQSTSTKEEEATNILIAPNPTNGVVYVSGLADEDKVVNVYSTSGSLIESIKTSETAVTLNISDLPNGIYIISVVQSEVTTNVKVVKQ